MYVHNMYMSKRVHSVLCELVAWSVGCVYSLSDSCTRVWTVWCIDVT